MQVSDVEELPQWKTWGIDPTGLLVDRLIELYHSEDGFPELPFDADDEMFDTPLTFDSDIEGIFAVMCRLLADEHRDGGFLLDRHKQKLDASGMGWRKTQDGTAFWETYTSK
jgi:hypothetical protein